MPSSNSSMIRKKIRGCPGRYEVTYIRKPRKAERWVNDVGQNNPMTFTLSKEFSIPSIVETRKCRVDGKYVEFTVVSSRAAFNEYYQYSTPHFIHVQDAKIDQSGIYHSFHDYFYGGQFNHVYRMPVLAIEKDEFGRMVVKSNRVKIVKV